MAAVEPLADGQWRWWCERCGYGGPAWDHRYWAMTGAMEHDQLHK